MNLDRNYTCWKTFWSFTSQYVFFEGFTFNKTYFENQTNAQQLISQNRLNKWKNFYGKNGLLFKLKIGREKEIAGEVERESVPLELTFGVCDDRDFVVFTSGNISFFLKFRFLLRWLSCFLSELDFYERSFRAWVWIFGLFGYGLCFGGVFHDGGGFEEECEQNLKSTLDGLDFGVLIISRWFGFRIGD